MPSTQEEQDKLKRAVELLKREVDARAEKLQGLVDDSGQVDQKFNQASYLAIDEKIVALTNLYPVTDTDAPAAVALLNAAKVNYWVAEKWGANPNTKAPDAVLRHKKAARDVALKRVNTACGSELSNVAGIPSTMTSDEWANESFESFMKRTSAPAVAAATAAGSVGATSPVTGEGPPSAKEGPLAAASPDANGTTAVAGLLAAVLNTRVKTAMLICGLSMDPPLDLDGSPLKDIKDQAAAQEKVATELANNYMSATDPGVAGMVRETRLAALDAVRANNLAAEKLGLTLVDDEKTRLNAALASCELVIDPIKGDPAKIFMLPGRAATFSKEERGRWAHESLAQAVARWKAESPTGAPSTAPPRAASPTSPKDRDAEQHMRTGVTTLIRAEELIKGTENSIKLQQLLSKNATTAEKLAANVAKSNDSMNPEVSVQRLRARLQIVRAAETRHLHAVAQPQNDPLESQKSADDLNGALVSLNDELMRLKKNETVTDAMIVAVTGSSRDVIGKYHKQLLTKQRGAVHGVPVDGSPTQGPALRRKTTSEKVSAFVCGNGDYNKFRESLCKQKALVEREISALTKSTFTMDELPSNDKGEVDMINGTFNGKQVRIELAHPIAGKIQLVPKRETDGTMSKETIATVVALLSGHIAKHGGTVKLPKNLLTEWSAEEQLYLLEELDKTGLLKNVRKEDSGKVAQMQALKKTRNAQAADASENNAMTVTPGNSPPGPVSAGGAGGAADAEETSGIRPPPSSALTSSPSDDELRAGAGAGAGAAGGVVDGESVSSAAKVALSSVGGGGGDPTVEAKCAELREQHNEISSKRGKQMAKCEELALDYLELTKQKDLEGNIPGMKPEEKYKAFKRITAPDATPGLPEKDIEAAKKKFESFKSSKNELEATNRELREFRSSAPRILAKLKGQGSAAVTCSSHASKSNAASLWGHQVMPGASAVAPKPQATGVPQTMRAGSSSAGGSSELRSPIVPVGRA